MKNNIKDLTPEAEALMMWKEISDTPSQDVPKHSLEDFKNRILEKLGIGNRIFGCPLCEKYNNMNSTENNCPIGKCVYNYNAFPLRRRQPCFYTPYEAWQNEFTRNNRHDQELAKAFYLYLLNKLK